MTTSKFNFKSFFRYQIFLFYYGVSQLPFEIHAKDLVRNDQLCPDPILNSNREERMFFMNHNLRVISVPVGGIVKSKEGAQEDIPCSFIDASNFGKPSSVQRVTIRAAQLSHRVWNYTGSGECRSFIKFRMNDKPALNETQLCRMYKIFGFENGFENMTNPPAIWTGPNYNIGFSISYPPTSSETVETESKLTYLHVVYKAHSAQRCVLKVQQYAMNPSSSECDAAGMQHQLCGTYNCSEQHKILKKLGFLPYDVVVNIDNLLGTYFSGKDRNGLHRWDYDALKNYDIERRDGDLYFKPKRNYHAALFSGMTRAISFLFVLSVLISCISYQLKPYLRPSSSFESDPVRERGHENHRRCYRRPATHLTLPLPFSRPPAEEIAMDHSHSTSTGTTSNNNNNRGHRSRRYFHHSNHRSVGAAPADLPSYNNQVLNEYYCQPPPAYETIQPPTYAETILRDGAPESQITVTHNNNNNNNNNSSATNNDSNK